MIDRNALIQCFTDSQRLTQEDAELSRATLRMQAGTVLYFPGYAAIDPPRKSENCPLAVVENTTYHCAGELVEKGRVAVLNFANAYSPGGGVTRGTMAQEESRFLY